MIHKLYTQQWLILIIGILFLIIAIVTLFRDVKRDKIIAVGVFVTCVILYLTGEVQIKRHNAKAEIYFGTHKLHYFNHSGEYTLEILPNKRYLIYDQRDTINNGEWELNVSDDKSTRLLLDDRPFGVGELEIE